MVRTSTNFAGDVSGAYNAIVIANDSHTHDGRYFTETESDGRYVRSNATNTTTGIRFQSQNVLDSASGTQASLEVFQDQSGEDAFMAFHVSGDYALYFGLDGASNDLAVGGWSLGAVKYKVWHAGNDGATSGLNADLLDGQHGSYYYPASNPNVYTSHPAANNNEINIIAGAGLGGGAAFTLDQNSDEEITLTLDTASSTQIGGIRTGYTDSGKNYALELDTNSRGYVNVPWTDTVYSLPLAASGTRGGVKIGYTETGKNYPVELSSEQMYVNVPWTDTVYSLPTNNVTDASISGNTLTLSRQGTSSVEFTATSYTLPAATASVRGGVKTGTAVDTGLQMSGDTIQLAASGSFVLDALSVNTINADKITANTITATQMAADSITAGQLAISNASSGNAGIYFSTTAIEIRDSSNTLRVKIGLL